MITRSKVVVTITYKKHTYTLTHTPKINIRYRKNKK